MGARRKLKVTNQGQVEFYEDVANGQHRAAMKSAASLAASRLRFSIRRPAAEQWRCASSARLRTSHSAIAST